MSAFNVSIVVPSVGDPYESSILRSFLEFDEKEKIHPQFVFLRNGAVIGGIKKSLVIHSDTHDILIIYNDRYFGSCEENASRAQDFVGDFKNHVFFVGEHDVIDWVALNLAISFSVENKIDALAWNILSLQKKSDGSNSAVPAILPLPEDSSSNFIVRQLISGDIVDGFIGYLALVSCYGPIDWAAYIGNHIFSLAAFGKLLQYRFSEFVYSFVYKQAMMFHEIPMRYGFFVTPVIHRVSTDFLKIRNGSYSSGWLAEHRTVHGNSPTFSIANLLHLCQIDDDLFDVLVNSICLSQHPGDNEDIGCSRGSTLLYIFGWSLISANHKIEGRSFYFPDKPSGALQELRYIFYFFSRFVNSIKNNPLVYSDIPEEFRTLLVGAKSALGFYLQSLNSNDDLIRNFIANVSAARSLINSEIIFSLNKKSFEFYVEKRGSSVNIRS